MEMPDFLMLVAVLLGPILAVQAQTFLERKRERRSRKLSVFRILMETRASKVSVDHVRALNQIDLEFYDKEGVRNAWALYRDHLNTAFDQAAISSWADKGNDLFVDLLYEMSQSLGFSFDKIQLKRAIYSPVAHGKAEQEELQIRAGMAAVVAGERAIAIRVSPDSTTAPS